MFLNEDLPEEILQQVAEQYAEIIIASLHCESRVYIHIVKTAVISGLSPLYRYGIYRMLIDIVLMRMYTLIGKFIYSENISFCNAPKDNSKRGINNG